MGLTPAMQQYHRIKDQYKDCILLFRMGDFYEMFYDDAKTASKVLDITLTSRNIRQQKIPLAGVPYHSIDPYIAKFVKSGYKLAICEQVEDPKFAKGVVKREVVRVVSPGMVMDDLDAKSNNFTVSLFCSDDKFGVGIVDLSTGEFFAASARNQEELFTTLAMHRPSEIIIPDSLFVNSKLIGDLKKIAFVTNLEDAAFRFDSSKQRLQEQFNVQTLDGFGLSDTLAVSAAGALLHYVMETQKNSLEFINKIKVLSSKKYMVLDEPTLKNLEIIRSVGNKKSNTLFSLLDKTQTAMGSRLLGQWILRPLLDVRIINARLDSVEELFNKTIIRKDLQSLLSKVQDIERLISKISYGKCNARDLVALKNSLRIIPLIKRELVKCDSKLLSILSKLPDLHLVFGLIEKAIKDEPCAWITDGNMIKIGFDQELDKLIDIKVNGREYLKKLEKREKERTGIKNLKVKFNKVFGYFIEVTKSNLKLVPEDYIRKQTLVNAERYVTEELKEHEDLILNAEEKIVDLEKKIFLDVVAQVASHTKLIQMGARKVANLDVLCSFAHVAVNSNYYRPIVNESLSISIEGARHPVLENIIPDFVPNTCKMENFEIMIITGPNMAGKSTYMRQNALIVIMSQMGSFVPGNVTVGVIDRIFTRVGAFDDLAHGQSTFMVEMSETANIMNNATSRSLIILDEIGRGTSTFDGVSIAWSVVEFIYNKIKAKTMFATHYHILNKLAENFENIKNYNIAVKDGDEVIFLRKIVEGGTNKSYGVHVAKLAGMPREIIDRAKEIQKKLEKEDNMIGKLKGKKDVKQMSLGEIGL